MAQSNPQSLAEGRTSPPKSSSSADGPVRTKPNISLFPDFSRHQFNTTSLPSKSSVSAKREDGQGKSVIGSQVKIVVNAGDSLYGLARAKQKAKESRRQDSQSPHLHLPSGKELSSLYYHLFTLINRPRQACCPKKRDTREPLVDLAFIVPT
jgi:hypothetical protein